MAIIRKKVSFTAANTHLPLHRDRMSLQFVHRFGCTDASSRECQAPNPGKGRQEGPRPLIIAQDTIQKPTPSPNDLTGDQHDPVQKPLELHGQQRRAILHQGRVVDVGNLGATHTLLDPSNDVAQNALGVIVEFVFDLGFTARFFFARRNGDPKIPAGGACRIVSGFLWLFWFLLMSPKTSSVAVTHFFCHHHG